MYIPHIQFIHSSIRHLGCVYLLAVVNNASMNVGVQISVPVSAVNFGGYISKSDIPGSYDNSVYFFEGLPCCFSQQLLHFTYLPAMHKGFSFSTSLSTLVASVFFFLSFWIAVILIMGVRLSFLVFRIQFVLKGCLMFFCY